MFSEHSFGIQKRYSNTLSVTFRREGVTPIKGHSFFSGHRCPPLNLALADEENLSALLKVGNEKLRFDLIFTAQQEAQRAQFLVEKAIQERQQKIVQAEGEAKAATLISFLSTVIEQCVRPHLPPPPPSLLPLSPELWKWQSVNCCLGPKNMELN